MAAGCRLQVDRWVAGITLSTALHFSLKPGDWSLKPHDVVAEEIVARREECREKQSRRARYFLSRGWTSSEASAANARVPNTTARDSGTGMCTQGWITIFTPMKASTREMP